MTRIPAQMNADQKGRDQKKEEIEKRREQKNKGAAVKHENVTERIIAAFYQVYNTLGWGFLEKVYRNAMLVELQARGLRVTPLSKIEVFYAGVNVGEYFADLLVEECVISELKAAEQLAMEHEAQLLNYLKASNIDVGLLLNFGPRPQVRRKVFETAQYRGDRPPAPELDQSPSSDPLHLR
jgi:GxxExxY protein